MRERRLDGAWVVVGVGMGRGMRMGSVAAAASVVADEVAGGRVCSTVAVAVRMRGEEGAVMDWRKRFQQMRWLWWWRRCAGPGGEGQRRIRRWREWRGGRWASVDGGAVVGGVFRATLMEQLARAPAEALHIVRPVKVDVHMS